MIEIIDCPTANLPEGMVIAICQCFDDPAYDHPIHYLYQNQSVQEQRCLRLTRERETVIPLGGPFYTAVEDSIYDQIIKSNGVLEGSCRNPPPPFPIDQDKV